MLQEERFSQIIAFIQGKKRVTLDELAKLTGVSAGTVRRDVKKLEESGVLTLVRGGVALRSEGLARQSFDLRNIDNKGEKQQLAQLVSEVVFDGQTIALNSGTTNLMIADFLVSHYRNLTVITNNLRIINILKAGNNFTLVLPCGIFDPEEYSVIGSRCEAEILNYAPDAVLLAVNALSLSKGVTDFRLFEAVIYARTVSAVGLIYHLYDVRKVCPVSLGYFKRNVGRAVVDYNNFHIVAARKQAVDTIFHIRLRVVAGYDKTYQFHKNHRVFKPRPMSLSFKNSARGALIKTQD